MRVLLPLLLGALVASAPAAARPAPSLALAVGPPVVLRGAHFGAREAVRVDAAGRRYTIRASRRGTFALSIGVLPRCGGIRVDAVGARGSVALLKLPRPACLPARSP
jgi:hypothetical protein